MRELVFAVIFFLSGGLWVFADPGFLKTAGTVGALVALFFLMREVALDRREAEECKTRFTEDLKAQGKRHAEELSPEDAQLQKELDALMR